MAPTISTAVYAASSSPFFHSGLQTGEQSEEQDQDQDQVSQMGDFDDDDVTIETASLTEVDISDVQNDLYASKFLPVNHPLQPRLGVYGEDTRMGSYSGLGSSSQHYSPADFNPPADDETGKHLVHFPSAPSLRHKDNMRINTISTSTRDPSDASNRSLAELEHLGSQGHLYHYITRSQSSATYPPRPRSSYYPYTNYNPRHSNSTPQFSTHFRNVPDPRYKGNLSPIEERSSTQGDSPQSPSFGQAVQADNVSLHSNLSVQSSLFLKRPVNPSRMRRSTSTSTLGSAISYPHTPVKESLHPSTSSGSNSSPMASGSGTSALPPRRGHRRSFSALSTIIASPRESQTNVLDQQLTPRTFSSVPLPRSYKKRPISAGSGISDVNGAPPIIEKTESSGSELTAQESDSNSQHHTKNEAPGVVNDRGKAREGAINPVSETLTHPRRNNLLKGFKATITSKSAQLKLWTWPGSWLATSPDHLPRQVDRIPQKWYQKETGETKTAEVLFWMGFIGPWFWIIGGWQLGRNGNVVDRDKRPDPGPSTMSRYYEYRNAALARLSTRPNVGSCFVPDPNARPTTLAPPNTRESAGLSYLQGPSFQPNISDTSSKVQHWLDTPTRETFMELPRNNNRSSSVQGLRSLHLVEAQTTRVDIWVTRCRIAAVLAGFIILALCVVAIVALALAL